MSLRCFRALMIDVIIISNSLSASLSLKLQILQRDWHYWRENKWTPKEQEILNHQSLLVEIFQHRCLELQLAPCHKTQLTLERFENSTRAIVSTYNICNTEVFSLVREIWRYCLEDEKASYAYIPVFIWNIEKKIYPGYKHCSKYWK